MRPRLLPVALILCALAPARIAAADDGSIIKRNPVAPIAGTPIWSKIEVEAPPRKPKSAALVILGAIIGGLGAAGVITGSVLLGQTQGGCTTAGVKDENFEYWIDPITRARVNPTPQEKQEGKYPRFSGVSAVGNCSGRDQKEQIGMTTLLISAGVAAAGFATVLVAIQPRADEEPSPSARFVPTIAVGPTGGTLTWRF